MKKLLLLLFIGFSANAITSNQCKKDSECVIIDNNAKPLLKKESIRVSHVCVDNDLFIMVHDNISVFSFTLDPQYRRCISESKD